MPWQISLKSGHMPAGGESIPQVGSALPSPHGKGHDWTMVVADTDAPSLPETPGIKYAPLSEERRTGGGRADAEGTGQKELQ